MLSLVLTSGCGSLGSSLDGVTLGVPYRQQFQLDWDYCGPANVLMWRLYNGYSDISQQTIYDWMGVGGTGTSPEEIRDALVHWANVSWADFDRVACDGGPYDEREIIAARQITSVDNDEPVIVIVESGFHSVLIDGGDWHYDSSTGLDVWDVTYIHDPAEVAGDHPLTAGEWIDQFASGYTCEQVFDESAVGNTGYNLETYGNQVVAYGYDGPRIGGDPIPK